VAQPLLDSGGVKLATCLAILVAGCGADGATDGPVGSEFAVTRVQVSASPCPRFAEEDVAHHISVQAIDELTVDHQAATQIRVLASDAIQDSGDEPNIVFTIRESWTSEQGLAAAPVSYRLWAHESDIAGMAATSFPFDTPTSGTDCSYGWLVSGTRL
jgi:hypothetical protein